MAATFSLFVFIRTVSSSFMLRVISSICVTRTLDFFKTSTLWLQFFFLLLCQCLKMAVCAQRSDWIGLGSLKASSFCVAETIKYNRSGSRNCLRLSTHVTRHTEAPPTHHPNPFGWGYIISGILFAPHFVIYFAVEKL